YLGNHSGNSDGKYTSPPFSHATINAEESNFKQEAERRTGRVLLPSEVSSYWFKQGVAEAASNPGLSLIRYERRLRWTIGNEELPDTRHLDFYRDLFNILKLPILWGFGMVSFLGMVGTMILIRVKEKKALFSVLFAGIYILAISLFFVFGRFRMPLLVPFSILAGAGIMQAYRQLEIIRMRGLILSLPLLFFLSWLSFGEVLPKTESYFPEYFNMGTEYNIKGKYEDAASEYEKALWVHPSSYAMVQPLVLGLAEYYVSRGKLAAAQRLLQKAITTYPDNKTYAERLVALRKRQQ
ncbi:MAG: tetratricopeptide repeat protein, partial [Gallionella sp.]